MPFKVPQKKPKQNLQPQAPVLQQGSFLLPPKTSWKINPRLWEGFKVFAHSHSLVWSFSLGRNSMSGLSVSPPSWASEALPCISPPHGNPLSVIFHQQRPCCLCRRLFLSGKHSQASLESTWQCLTACCNARHLPRLFPASALALPHYSGCGLGFFYLSHAEWIACTNDNLFFSINPVNRLLFWSCMWQQFRFQISYWGIEINEISAV